MGSVETLNLIQLTELDSFLAENYGGSLMYTALSGDPRVGLADFSTPDRRNARTHSHCFYNSLPGSLVFATPFLFTLLFSLYWQSGAI